MSKKAVLVIDMPKSCLDCRLTDNEYGDCVADIDKLFTEVRSYGTSN